MSLPQSLPQSAQSIAPAPAARRLAHGRDWQLSEYVCSAGPADRSFEECHEHTTVAAVVDGSFTYRSNTGRAVLYPGALLLGNRGACFECGHDHSYGDRCVTLHVTGDYFAEVAASAACTGRFEFSTPALQAVPRVLPWLARLEANTADDRPLIADEAVLAFVEAVIATASGARPSTVSLSARDERRIGVVMRHIEANASDKLDLGALSGLAGMSKYHFLRTFRRHVGMTPYQYILSVRMRRAAVQLSLSSARISEIAFDAGFGDLSTFNNRFRQIFHTSPAKYRRSN